MQSHGRPRTKSRCRHCAQTPERCRQHSSQRSPSTRTPAAREVGSRHPPPTSTGFCSLRATAARAMPPIRG
ncbi:Uncharacterized protein ToN1_27160 [Aromatoleum petrolei]|nr:Uncharacterized protein ToN1_27160 [Aromatoleum petrolei]